MADGASFPQRRVLKNDRLGLFAMTLGARLIQPGHGQPASRFHDVLPVRIVALHATHFPFEDRMMLWKMEFGLLSQMALETRLRILAWIDDEFSTATAHCHVLAAGAMAGFATVLTFHLAVRQMKPGMGAGGKDAGDIGVAFLTGFVPDEGGPFDFGRRQHGALDGRTGIEQQPKRAHACRH